MWLLPIPSYRKPNNSCPFLLNEPQHWPNLAAPPGIFKDIRGLASASIVPLAMGYLLLPIETYYSGDGLLRLVSVRPTRRGYFDISADFSRV